MTLTVFHIDADFRCNLNQLQVHGDIISGLSDLSSEFDNTTCFKWILKVIATWYHWAIFQATVEIQQNMMEYIELEEGIQNLILVCVVPTNNVGCLATVLKTWKWWWKQTFKYFHEAYQHWNMLSIRDNNYAKWSKPLIFKKKQSPPILPVSLLLT